MFTFLLNAALIFSSTTNNKFYQLTERKNIIRSTILNLESLFDHLSKALFFFENNFKSINVDGLFGIRISQVILILSYFLRGVKFK